MRLNMIFLLSVQAKDLGRLCDNDNEKGAEVQTWVLFQVSHSVHSLMPAMQSPLARFKEKFKTSWAWAFLRDDLIYNLFNKLLPGVQRSKHMDRTLKPPCQTGLIFLIHKMESLSRSVLLNISFTLKPLWEILDLPKSRGYLQRFWFH